MSVDDPRPLPPRALPPLNTERVEDGQPLRTPRKKTRQTTGGQSGARSKRAATGPNLRSPRSEQARSDAVSPRPSAGPSEADETQVSENSGTPSQRRVKRTRRRKLPPGGNQETSRAELVPDNSMSSFIKDEDVVNVDKIDDAIVMTNLPWIPAGSGGSAMHDKVFVQTTNGFAAHSQDWVDQRNKATASEARLTYGEESVKPFNIAKQNEKGFMFLTLVLHGTLAGLSIWQVVASYSLFYPGVTNFLAQYQSLAMPTQTVYYIILVFCTVSAMDRYDFAGKDKHIFQSLAKFDLASVSVVIYYIALAFSVGIAGLDAWIASGVALGSGDSVTATTSTLAPLPAELTGENLDATTTVDTWLILNIFRAVFASLGWLIIAFDPMRNDMTFEE